MTCNCSLLGHAKEMPFSGLSNRYSLPPLTSAHSMLLLHSQTTDSRHCNNVSAMPVMRTDEIAPQNWPRIGELNLEHGYGASSHLNSSVNNLSTIFNSRIYPSVLVGDGKSIPVTNMGHSTLPTPYRTLHLN
ncbi:hypothetical protein Tco_0834932 [Tanacetum coccineum]